MIKGRCGENAVYEFDTETGVLIVSGTGAIEAGAFDSFDAEEEERKLAPYIKEVVIEDGIIEIGSYAFFDCTNLISITIPNSVIIIKNHAFWYCNNLTSVTISKSITSIEDGAFQSCTSLTSIIISDNVKNIGRNAFYLTNLKTKKKNYKAFNLENNNISCMGYKYMENEWSETLDGIEPDKRGYHYCDNLFNIFNHYRGEIDKNIVIYECEVGDIVVPHDDKIVTNKIKPVKRLYREDVIRILNGEE